MGHRSKAIFMILGVAFASPAYADDWTLMCTFGGGVETVVQYDAGWPRHTIAVTRGGSQLETTKALPAGRISNERELLLFVNRQDEPKQERNVFIRINSDTMRARLEGGSGGFDYVNLSGTCRTL